MLKNCKVISQEIPRLRFFLYTLYYRDKLLVPMFELRGIAISCSPDNLQEVMKGRQNIYLIIMRSFLKDYLFWLENNKFGLIRSLQWLYLKKKNGRPRTFMNDHYVDSDQKGSGGEDQSNSVSFLAKNHIKSLQISSPRILIQSSAARLHADIPNIKKFDQLNNLTVIKYDAVFHMIISV